MTFERNFEKHQGRSQLFEKLQQILCVKVDCASKLHLQILILSSDGLHLLHNLIISLRGDA